MNVAHTNSASIQTAVSELMEALPYGFILRLDACLQVLTAEGSGLAALGLEPTALIGQTLPALLPPKLRELIEPRLWDAVNGAASSFELAGAGDGRLLLAAAPTPQAQLAQLTATVKDRTQSSCLASGRGPTKTLWTSGAGTRSGCSGRSGWRRSANSRPELRTTSTTSCR